MKLSVRPMLLKEIPLVIDYFHSASEEYLRGMGVDPGKLPSRDELHQIAKQDFQLPNTERQFYYLAWEFGGKVIGHHNINMIKYGVDARMHLHVWPSQHRKKGLGTQFVKLSLPIYFREFDLQRLFCEPYSENPGPNFTLPKAGFKFLEQVETVPGWINFHQKINRYVIKREKVIAG